MKTEKPYAFRERLLAVHRPGLRDINRHADKHEFEVKNGASINILGKTGEVCKTAVQDLIDFMRISMGVYCRMAENEPQGTVTVALAETAGKDLGTAAGYKGFMLEADEAGIGIYGYDERGIALGIYYLEFLMSCERAPLLGIGSVRKKPTLSPRMVHSGYGLDEYPDAYLSRIAHEGRDAILVFTKDVNETPGGYLDFNDLIRRAARYGLDVYAYSYLHSDMSPEAPEAEAYYDHTYGRLFRECPGLKGVTLVGESNEFPSRDPHAAKGKYYETAVDGIPSDKPSSGWYPCEDYPIWLAVLKKVIRRYNPEADIVFWTYNWGSAPEEARLKLIESLPTDISLQATFEMYEPRIYGQTMGICADYTLAFEGPGAYFKSEAEAAKKRGIRLYSMTNTGGLTWDFGVIPYEPMPQQWIRRCEAMRKAQEDWGLCGVMESHHYGFTPSFVSQLTNLAFLEPFEDPEALLVKILKNEFGTANYTAVDCALRSWSEAIRYYTPSNIDQYGAFRVGPSYPFNLSDSVNIPSDERAMFGNVIVAPIYDNGASPANAPLTLRIYEELTFLQTMLRCIREGLTALEDAPEQNEETERLYNLGRFMEHSVITGIHAKQFHVLKCRLYNAENSESFANVLNELEALLCRETENVEATIPLVNRDSRLGWEPSMLYMTDEWHLRWKIRQLRYVLDSDLAHYRTSLSHMQNQ